MLSDSFVPRVSHRTQVDTVADSRRAQQATFRAPINERREAAKVACVPQTRLSRVNLGCNLLIAEPFCASFARFVAQQLCDFWRNSIKSIDALRQFVCEFACVEPRLLSTLLRFVAGSRRVATCGRKLAKFAARQEVRRSLHLRLRNVEVDTKLRAFVFELRVSVFGYNFAQFEFELHCFICTCSRLLVAQSRREMRAPKASQLFAFPNSNQISRLSIGFHNANANHVFRALFWHSRSELRAKLSLQQFEPQLKLRAHFSRNQQRLLQKSLLFGAQFAAENQSIRARIVASAAKAICATLVNSICDCLSANKSSN